MDVVRRVNGWRRIGLGVGALGLAAGLVVLAVANDDPDLGLETGDDLGADDVTSSSVTATSAPPAPEHTTPPTTAPVDASPSVLQLPIDPCTAGEVIMETSLDREVYRAGDTVVVTASVSSRRRTCTLPARDHGDPSFCQPEVLMHRAQLDEDGNVVYNALLGPFHPSCDGTQRVVPVDGRELIVVSAPFTGGGVQPLQAGEWTVIANWIGTPAVGDGVLTTFVCPPDACDPASSPTTAPPTTTSTSPRETTEPTEPTTTTSPSSTTTQPHDG